ncbi:MAG: tetratricopeptide repeat protein, partial [Candidatus Omnitrophica bacterium]|nr:tetratricopeptide repeat protein [Candidatus Omnitrophota bacterium]
EQTKKEKTVYRVDDTVGNEKQKQRAKKINEIAKALAADLGFELGVRNDVNQLDKALHLAFDKNTIWEIPSGTGKTAALFTFAAAVLKECTGQKVIFVLHSRNLYNDAVKDSSRIKFFKNSDIDIKTEGFTSNELHALEKGDKNLAERFEQADVIYMEADTLGFFALNTQQSNKHNDKNKVLAESFVNIFAGSKIICDEVDTVFSKNRFQQGVNPRNLFDIEKNSINFVDKAIRNIEIVDSIGNKVKIGDISDPEARLAAQRSLVEVSVIHKNAAIKETESMSWAKFNNLGNKHEYTIVNTALTTEAKQSVIEYLKSESGGIVNARGDRIQIEARVDTESGDIIFDAADTENLSKEAKQEQFEKIGMVENIKASIAGRVKVLRMYEGENIGHDPDSGLIKPFANNTLAASLQLGDPYIAGHSEVVFKDYLSDSAMAKEVEANGKTWGALLDKVTVSGESRVTTMARALKMTKDLGADFSGFSGTVSAVTKLATWFYGTNTVLHTVDGKTPESRLLTDKNITLNVKGSMADALADIDLNSPQNAGKTFVLLDGRGGEDEQGGIRLVTEKFKDAGYTIIAKDQDVGWVLIKGGETVKDEQGKTIILATEQIKNYLQGGAAVKNADGETITAARAKGEKVMFYFNLSACRGTDTSLASRSAEFIEQAASLSGIEVKVHAFFNQDTTSFFAEQLIKRDRGLSKFALFVNGTAAEVEKGTLFVDHFGTTLTVKGEKYEGNWEYQKETKKWQFISKADNKAIAGVEGKWQFVYNDSAGNEIADEARNLTSGEKYTAVYNDLTINYISKTFEGRAPPTMQEIVEIFQQNGEKATETMLYNGLAEIYESNAVIFLEGLIDSAESVPEALVIEELIRDFQNPVSFDTNVILQKTAQSPLESLQYKIDNIVKFFEKGKEHDPRFAKLCAENKAKINELIESRPNFDLQGKETDIIAEKAAELAADNLKLNSAQKVKAVPVINSALRQIMASSVERKAAIVDKLSVDLNELGIEITSNDLEKLGLKKAGANLVSIVDSAIQSVNKARAGEVTPIGLAGSLAESVESTNALVKENQLGKVAPLSGPTMVSVQEQSWESVAGSIEGASDEFKEELNSDFEKRGFKRGNNVTQSGVKFADELNSLKNQPQETRDKINGMAQGKALSVDDDLLKQLAVLLWSLVDNNIISLNVTSKASVNRLANMLNTIAVFNGFAEGGSIKIDENEVKSVQHSDDPLTLAKYILGKIDQGEHKDLHEKINSIVETKDKLNKDLKKYKGEVAYLSGEVSRLQLKLLVLQQETSEKEDKSLAKKGFIKNIKLLAANLFLGKINGKLNTAQDNLKQAEQDYNNFAVSVGDLRSIGAVDSISDSVQMKNNPLKLAAMFNPDISTKQIKKAEEVLVGLMKIDGLSAVVNELSVQNLLHFQTIDTEIQKKILSLLSKSKNEDETLTEGDVKQLSLFENYGEIISSLLQVMAKLSDSLGSEENKLAVINWLAGTNFTKAHYYLGSASNKLAGEKPDFAGALTDYNEIIKDPKATPGQKIFANQQLAVIYCNSKKDYGAAITVLEAALGSINEVIDKKQKAEHEISARSLLGEVYQIQASAEQKKVAEEAYNDVFGEEGQKGTPEEIKQKMEQVQARIKESNVYETTIQAAQGQYQQIIDIADSLDSGLTEERKTEVKIQALEKLAAVHENLLQYYQGKEDDGSVAKEFEQIAGIFTGLAGLISDPADARKAEFLGNLVQAHEGMGEYYAAKNDSARAEKAYNSAVRTLDDLLAFNPNAEQKQQYNLDKGRINLKRAEIKIANGEKVEAQDILKNILTGQSSDPVIEAKAKVLMAGLYTGNVQPADKTELVKMLTSALITAYQSGEWSTLKEATLKLAEVKGETEVAGLIQVVDNKIKEKGKDLLFSDIALLMDKLADKISASFDFFPAQEKNKERKDNYVSLAYKMFGFAPNLISHYQAAIGSATQNIQTAKDDNEKTEAVNTLSGIIEKAGLILEKGAYKEAGLLADNTVSVTDKMQLRFMLAEACKTVADNDPKSEMLNRAIFLLEQNAKVQIPSFSSAEYSGIRAKVQYELAGVYEKKEDIKSAKAKYTAANELAGKAADAALFISSAVKLDKLNGEDNQGVSFTKAIDGAVEMVKKNTANVRQAGQAAQKEIDKIKKEGLGELTLKEIWDVVIGNLANAHGVKSGDVKRYLNATAGQDGANVQQAADEALTQISGMIEEGLGGLKLNDIVDVVIGNIEIRYGQQGRTVKAEAVAKFLTDTIKPETKLIALTIVKVLIKEADSIENLNFSRYPALNATLRKLTRDYIFGEQAVQEKFDAMEKIKDDKGNYSYKDLAPLMEKFANDIPFAVENEIVKIKLTYALMGFDNSKLNDQAANHYLALGVIASEKSDDESAIERFKTVIELGKESQSPQNLVVSAYDGLTRAFLGRVNQYAAEPDVEGIEIVCRDMEKNGIAPNALAKAYQTLAETYRANGDERNALTAYGKAEETAGKAGGDNIIKASAMISNAVIKFQQAGDLDALDADLFKAEAVISTNLSAAPENKKMEWKAMQTGVNILKQAFTGKGEADFDAMVSKAAGELVGSAGENPMLQLTVGFGFEPAVRGYVAAFTGTKKGTEASAGKINAANPQRVGKLVYWLNEQYFGGLLQSGAKDMKAGKTEAASQTFEKITSSNNAAPEQKIAAKILKAVASNGENLSAIDILLPTFGEDPQTVSAARRIIIGSMISPEAQEEADAKLNEFSERIKQGEDVSDSEWAGIVQQLAENISPNAPDKAVGLAYNLIGIKGISLDRHKELVQVAKAQAKQEIKQEQATKPAAVTESAKPEGEEVNSAAEAAQQESLEAETLKASVQSEVKLVKTPVYVSEPAEISYDLIDEQAADEPTKPAAAQLTKTEQNIKETPPQLPAAELQTPSIGTYVGGAGTGAVKAAESPKTETLKINEEAAFDKSQNHFSTAQNHLENGRITEGLNSLEEASRAIIDVGQDGEHLRGQIERTQSNVVEAVNFANNHLKPLSDGIERIKNRFERIKQSLSNPTEKQTQSLGVFETRVELIEASLRLLQESTEKGEHYEKMNKKLADLVTRVWDLEGRLQNRKQYFGDEGSGKSIDRLNTAIMMVKDSLKEAGVTIKDFTGKQWGFPYDGMSLDAAVGDPNGTIIMITPRIFINDGIVQKGKLVVKASKGPGTGEGLGAATEATKEQPKVESPKVEAPKASIPGKGGLNLPITRTEDSTRQATTPEGRGIVMEFNVADIGKKGTTISELAQQLGIDESKATVIFRYFQQNFAKSEGERAVPAQFSIVVKEGLTNPASISGNVITLDKDLFTQVDKKDVLAFLVHTFAHEGAHLTRKGEAVEETDVQSTDMERFAKWRPEHQQSVINALEKLGAETTEAGRAYVKELRQNLKTETISKQGFDTNLLLTEGGASLIAAHKEGLESVGQGDFKTAEEKFTLVVTMAEIIKPALLDDNSLEALNTIVADAHLNLGNIYNEKVQGLPDKEQKGFMSAAEGYYKKALANNPELAEGYFNSGVLYMKQDRFGEAKVAFETTISIEKEKVDNNNPELTKRAESLKEQAKIGTAILPMKQGIDNFSAGNYEKASENFKEVIKNGKEDPRLENVVSIALFNLGLSQWEAGNTKDAEVTFNEFRKGFGQTEEEAVARLAQLPNDLVNAYEFAGKIVKPSQSKDVVTADKKNILLLEPNTVIEKIEITPSRKTAEFINNLFSGDPLTAPEPTRNMPDMIRRLEKSGQAL